MAGRRQEFARIRENTNYCGDYYRIVLDAPQISAACLPGQFVDLQLPNAPQLLLRRPFSIFNTDRKAGTLSLLYKTVGQGTREMAALPPETELDLLGPLGNGFPSPEDGQPVIIVAGGYGCAATYLIAKRHDNPGTCLIGGRTATDVLLQEEFTSARYQVEVSTNDGSLGHKGFVTDLLETCLAGLTGPTPAIYACGPNAMLMAVAEISLAHSIDAYVSLDQNMCCGVGACYSCVVKLKADTPEGWEYVRSCREGPVFPASRIHWD